MFLLMSFIFALAEINHKHTLLRRSQLICIILLMQNVSSFVHSANLIVLKSLKVTVTTCVSVHVAVTPPDLMDQGATMWHPTLRKSSCSSCSQGSLSDGAMPKGCNHER